jgi:hypothetical protein
MTPADTVGWELGFSWRGRGFNSQLPLFFQNLYFLVLFSFISFINIIKNIQKYASLFFLKISKNPKKYVYFTYILLEIPKNLFLCFLFIYYKNIKKNVYNLLS